MRKKLNAAERKTTGLTIKVTEADAECFRKACHELDVLPATVIRTFVEKCSKDGKIPVEYLPANLIAKMEAAIKNVDKYREILNK